jgi:hypothetical protein
MRDFLGAPDYGKKYSVSPFFHITKCFVQQSVQGDPDLEVFQ